MKSSRRRRCWSGGELPTSLALVPAGQTSTLALAEPLPVATGCGGERGHGLAGAGSVMEKPPTREKEALGPRGLHTRLRALALISGCALVSWALTAGRREALACPYT